MAKFLKVASDVWCPTPDTMGPLERCSAPIPNTDKGTRAYLKDIGHSIINGDFWNSWPKWLTQGYRNIDVTAENGTHFTWIPAIGPDIIAIKVDDPCMKYKDQLFRTD